MGRFVIVAYRPKPGRAEDLKALVARHVDVLRQEGLATDHPASVMQAADGAIVEVFEWVSADAIARAHSNPVVGAMWGEFFELCDFFPLNTLPETGQLFAEFESLALEG